MMKHEFERLIGGQVTLGNYKVIEFVYTWHPCISNEKGKQQITDLYKLGGMSIIKSMVDVAKKAQVIEHHISHLREELKHREQELEALRNGDWDCGLTDDERRNAINVHEEVQNA